MKDKTEEIINNLFKSNLESLKDESLDIDLSVCATIPLPSTENDCSLQPSEFWTGDVSCFPDEDLKTDLINVNNSNNNGKRQLLQPKRTSLIFDDDQNNVIDNLDVTIKCDYCCEFFKSEESLRAHKLNHTHNTFKCENCDIVFLDESSLKKHSIIHRTTKESNSRDAQCPDCGKMLKERSMWMHRKIHSDTKRFCCDLCGQKFVQKINFTHHMRIHTAEGPYVCSQCKKTFFSFSHLLRHQKYHSAARPFKCEKCEKMYKTERCLKVHSLVHLDQRPFVCSVCNKSFISSSKLKQHINIHTGERPYKCNYCSRDFTNFPNWLKHTRRRHKVDHKTGELLPTTPKIKPTKSSTASHIVKNPSNDNCIAGKEVVDIKPDEIKNELDYIGSRDLSSALSITTTDDYIMQQALEMEEYYGDIDKVNNEEAQSDMFTYSLPTFSQTKFDFTNEHVLP